MKNRDAANAEDTLGDLHMQLSNKYMAYKDLAERCLLNPNQLDKGDRRVFYMKPSTPFLQEPREQNKFRATFLEEATRPPNPEPLTLLADDLHKAYIEKTRDQSHPSITKDSLANYFKRRQYRLQHKKHKLLLRWAHHCLTSDLVDRVSLKFSPAYSKIQFELENSVKRFGRLDGEDHFRSTERPTPGEHSSYENVKEKPPLSALRADDVDVYLRCITYEDKVSRIAEKFVQKAKWLPLTHRFEIHKASIETFQRIRNTSLTEQDQFRAAVEDKCKLLIDVKKLGDRGVQEMKQILQAAHVRKLENRVKNARDRIMQTAKYNYEMPPLALSNEVELKLELARMAKIFGITGNQEIDNGHPFSYSVMVHFPQKFEEQTIKSMFAPYDANPVRVEMDNQSIKNVLKRNQKRFGRSSESGTQRLQSDGGTRPQGKSSSEFVNSIESSIFGEFNNGQSSGLPSIRVKKSDWLEFICFKPQLDNEQMYQASILASEKNWTDDCLSYMMEILNVQDVSTVNLMLDSLAQIHSDKVKFGTVKTEILNFQPEEADTFFTEDQKQFLNLFKGCFKTKAGYDRSKTMEALPANSLHGLPQHLLFAKYLVECLNARENKIKLLHILNAFRTIQRRLTLELREMGTRDRVLGDAELVRPMEGGNGGDEETQDGTRKSVIGRTAEEAANKEKNEQIDVINDALIDINKYRYNDRLSNYMYSTCPIVPKFHATFGQPIERQEISTEIDLSRNADVKQGEGQKLLGRADRIYLHKSSGLYLVQDDFGVHILQDSAFADMRSLETELLKACSFYINKAEPLLDNDLKNIYPAVDRLKMLEQVLDYERQYQEEKLRFVTAQLECFEHISDILEQQRLIQAMVDEMARRPRLNLSGTHLKDSYVAEIDCLREKTKLIRQLMRALIRQEFHENTQIREYIEKTYRLLHEQMEHKWSYTKPEKLEGELNKRELIQTGVAGTREAKVDEHLSADGVLVPKTEQQAKALEEKVQREASNIFSTKFGDPKEFANHLGMPYSSLQMLMKDHHERDPLVRQAIHEHVSFIKIQEGYPQFLYPCARAQNQVKFTEESESIGLLDFYESLSAIPRILSSMRQAFTELEEVHRPDNGLLTACLELNCIKSLTALLQTSMSEVGGHVKRVKGIEHIEDDEILGTSDKMLFYTKELEASAEDEGTAHNPFVVGKLDMNSIQNFNFDNFQGYLGSRPSQESLGGDAKDQAEAARRVKVDKKNFGRFFPKLHERSALISIPSMLILSCNTIEALRLRNTLSAALEQAAVLEELFLKQTRLMGKDGLIYFQDKLKFVEYLPGATENFVNFIDDGPASDLDMKLAINEFDPTLRSALNFSDPECFKALILPLGLEELRAVVRYEVMNLQLLIVATKTNQVQLDNSQRKLCEIGFLESGFTVANPVFNVFEQLQGKNLFESNLRRLPAAERAAVNSYVMANIGGGHYNIVARKTHMRSHVEKVFQTIRSFTASLAKKASAADPEAAQEAQKIEVALRELRTARLLLCHDYCSDVLARLCCDSIKLQLLDETDRLRKRAYLLPRDSMVLELFPPSSGEHQFAAYNEELKEGVQRDQMLFQSKSDNRIQSFWRLPPNHEVTSIPMDMTAFRAKNMPAVLNYALSAPTEKPELLCGDALTRIQQRNQKLTLIESRDAESVTSKKSRLVDFAEAYDYESAGKALKLLSYFKSLSNLLDLEFFTNKLASSAFTMANVEKMVLAGVPFWEEGDEALFAALNDDDEDGEHKATASDADRFEDGGHRPQKNILATIVAERIAKEKREKMQLLQDLEAVKDRFSVYESIMNKQEMSTSLSRAATFLNDLHHINFYGVLFILHQMQDNYLKEQKGQKEVQFINELIQNLSHQQDLKVTYSNGFHVNRAITALNRLDLEAGCHNQEYDSFFKATQPIIDEEALNPPEYNLVAGIYLTNSINLSTFKKNTPYMGALMPRDYGCLDFALTNLSKEVRKYATTNFASVEDTLRNFLRAKSDTAEEDFQSNPAIYSEILQDKKRFLRLQIKARQSRRVLMMIMSKKPIPMDINEYNKIYTEYQERIQWKVVDQIDRIAQSRAGRGSPTKRGKDSAAGLRQITETSSHMKAYDQATSEIDVVHAELQKYMMSTALAMFKRETDSLVKAFEMSNLQIQAFIHPVQQFASTLEQEIDNRHHLDIVNKVGPMQKMLTQIKNRSLEIQTLTSGTGVVISSKDLNECLAECCRALVKHGEIEMRTRCEYLAMTMNHYQQLLYVKDRQLSSLDNKLQTAKTELNRIVSTKVFSHGNSLVYELDMATRQLRLLKDNIFLLESNLTEKIRLCYDRELDQARMQLADLRKQFHEYQESVSAQIKARVREEVNSIDGVMQAKAAKFKDLGVKTAQQKEREEATERQERLLQREAASGSYRSGRAINNTTINIENLFMQKNQAAVAPTGLLDPKRRAELEALKANEKEARQEVLALQDIIRKQRLMNKFKEVLVAERHQFKIDNLKQQLTSNTTLWEQLAESKQREKILQGEIDRAQQEIATQEKICERLKDELKKERRDKQKLLDYKSTKSKRLDELETQAREFEVLSSVNLTKILSLLEHKDRKLTELQGIESGHIDFVESLARLQGTELKQVQQKANEETKFKLEAIGKLENLRQEMQAVKGGEQVSATFWKEQCQNLFDMCRYLQDRNERLADGVGDNDQGVSFHDPDFPTHSMMTAQSELNRNFEALAGKAAFSQDNLGKSIMLQTPIRRAPGEFQDHLLASTKSIDGTRNAANGTLSSVMAGSSSKQSRLSDVKDQALRDRQIQLPIIKAVKSRNHGTKLGGVADSAGLRASRTEHPNSNKPGAHRREGDSIGSAGLARVTAIHARKQPGYSPATKLTRASDHHPASLGDLHAAANHIQRKGANVFASLQKTSLLQPATANLPSAEDTMYYSQGQLPRRAADRTAMNTTNNMTASGQASMTIHSKLMMSQQDKEYALGAGNPMNTRARIPTRKE